MVNDGPKYVLYGGIAVAAIAGTYYLITDVFKASSCTTPGSACYIATAPYQQAFQNCASTYATELKSYLAQNDAAGTGLTASQLSTLNYLTACMNSNAAQIAKTAAATNPALISEMGSVLESIAVPIAAAAAVAAGIVYGIPAIIRAVRSGSGVASALNAAVTDNGVASGEISTASAGAEITSFQDVQPVLASDSAGFFASLATDGFMGEADATASTVIDSGAINAAESFIEEALSSL